LKTEINVDAMYCLTGNREFLSKGNLKGLCAFKIGRKEIRTAKCEDDIVLLAATDGLIEVGRCCGMEMSVGIKSGNESIKAAFPNIDYGRSETTGKCGIFQLFG
jgi:hypothetical protein